MGEIISWVAANYQMVIGVAGTVVMGASIVVKGLGPFLKHTDKDERAASWLDKVHGWLSKLALNSK